MKLFKIVPLILVLILFSCSKNDDRQHRNPYLTNPVVSLNLNLNLPEYNPLQFPGSYVTVSQGIKGIVVYCISENYYVAFDLTDPNHPPNECSRMEMEGIIASCQCANDSNEYFITTGLHKTEPNSKYPMQQYRAERVGNSVQITN